MRDLPPTPPGGIALFDMDGTLLAWDCQLLFRHHVLRAEPARWFAVPLFILALPFAPVLGTENMKRVFHYYLWKIPPELLAMYSREFAKRLLPSVYPELIAALKRHREAGDLTILSSASPECYAAEVGRLLGFDLSLGTVFEDRSFFPELENHKGANKVARLRKLLPAGYFRGDRLVNSHGYTDSTADLPMLAICDTATVVNPKPPLTALAEENGWPVLRPPRPWKNKTEWILRVLALVLAIGKNPAKL
jgi:HAD superfamily hydrolase (TIGR01490 family)